MSGLDSAWNRFRQLFRKTPQPDHFDQAEADMSEIDDVAGEVDVAPAVAGPGPRDLFYASSDGLRLHVAEYGDAISPWLPVVCIPGLSRSARDFHELGLYLSQHPQRPRRVIAFDLRGRGMSEWDEDIAHYTPIVEMQDVLDGMTALGVDRAVIVGTSRGGIIAMLMAVARPSVIAGVVLNDIGPAIEPRGLARLKTYIGRTPAPDDWDDAAYILRRLHGKQFTALRDDEWRAFARMTWRDDGGLPVGNYDPALASTFDGVEFDRPLPTLWREFAALSSRPVLTIRGENSDIFDAETLARMEREHPRFDRIVIEGEGHAPLLLRETLLQRISAFIMAAEDEGLPADATAMRASPRSDPPPRSGPDPMIEAGL
jgi:pimeloyl-ACP methyl ester carboxylesterase